MKVLYTVNTMKISKGMPDEDNFTNIHAFMAV